MFVTQYMCKKFLFDVTDRRDQMRDYETEKNVERQVKYIRANVA